MGVNKLLEVTALGPIIRLILTYINIYMFLILYPNQ